MSLVYAFGLLLLCYVFVASEFFIPSAGLLGAAAVATGVASLVIAFTHSFTAGVTFVIIHLITLPLVLVSLVRIWPKTPIGRLMLNRRPGEVATMTERVTSRGTPLKDLVGRVGVAKTDLLPSGQVIIDDEKLDATSLGMPIDAGTHIFVARLEGSRIRVRPASEGELSSMEPTSTPSSPPALETFDLEQFDSEGLS